LVERLQPQFLRSLRVGFSYLSAGTGPARNRKFTFDITAETSTSCPPTNSRQTDSVPGPDRSSPGSRVFSTSSLLRQARRVLAATTTEDEVAVRIVALEGNDGGVTIPIGAQSNRAADLLHAGKASVGVEVKELERRAITMASQALPSPESGTVPSRWRVVGTIESATGIEHYVGAEDGEGAALAIGQGDDRIPGAFQCGRPRLCVRGLRDGKGH